MARAPNYDFERRERQKAKLAKKAEKSKARAEKQTGDATVGASTQADSGENSNPQQAVDEGDIA